MLGIETTDKNSLGQGGFQSQLGFPKIKHESRGRLMKVNRGPGDQPQGHQAMEFRVIVQLKPRHGAPFSGFYFRERKNIGIVRTSRVGFHGTILP